MSTRLVVATDGSALKNPGKGGWAWAAQTPDGSTPTVWAAGSFEHCTNNVAELTAVLKVLESIPAHVPLHILADSQYVINALTKWVNSWKRKNWVSASNKPVANKELIEKIDMLLSQRDVTFEWVKAHVKTGGNPLNEFVDEAARRIAKAQPKTLHPYHGPGWPC